MCSYLNQGKIRSVKRFICNENEIVVCESISEQDMCLIDMDPVDPLV
jgi:hypothetical protein